MYRKKIKKIQQTTFLSVEYRIDFLTLKGKQFYQQKSEKKSKVICNELKNSLYFMNAICCI